MRQSSGAFNLRYIPKTGEPLHAANRDCESASQTLAITHPGVLYFRSSAPPMSGPAQHNAKNGTSTKPAIFVIDDEPMLLELATVILEPLGFAVKTFRDPSSAVEAFLASNPRPVLVITDYAMHKMTGLELIRTCRKAQPDQRVLMVSGTVGEDLFLDSAIKPDSFLAKPYHAKQLTDLVQTLLQG